jgi:hypothetical protein
MDLTWLGPRIFGSSSQTSNNLEMEAHSSAKPDNFAQK